jgi:hypothetical protein
LTLFDTAAKRDGIRMAASDERGREIMTHAALSITKSLISDK